MTTSHYYVYSLLDPREPTPRPFYVGKGTGSRAHTHLARPDATRKGQRIQEILAAGRAPVVQMLLDGLTEVEAIRFEAVLIGALGTYRTGGMLTNTLVPGGQISSPRGKATIRPHGAWERAQVGLDLLKSAIYALAQVNPGGITNADAAHELGLQSGHGTGSTNFLTYSVVGLLLRERRLRAEGVGRGRRYLAVGPG